ncbi:two-component system sensor histidine kinase NtrB [Megalodesulfovibrio paquesii]
MLCLLEVPAVSKDESPPSPSARAGDRATISRGLGVKIGAVVVLVELVSFALVAFWQHGYLERRYNAQFLERINAVSALMGQGLLSVESLAAPGTLRALLGEEPVMTLVLGADGHVYNAMEPELIGRNFSSLPGADPAWLAEARRGAVVRTVQEHADPDGQGEPRLICLAPLQAAGAHPPLFYTFLKLRMANSSLAASQMGKLFLLGGGLGVFLTSCLLLLVLHFQLFLPIRNTAEALRRLKSGQLHARVEGPLQNDQLGALQAGLNAMARSLEETVDRLVNEITHRIQAEEQLRQGNESLELRVQSRTRELEELNARLSREMAMRNVTEAALRDTNCRLQGVLDNSPTAIFVVDARHTVVLHNARFTALYGLVEENVEGRRVQTLFEEIVTENILRTCNTVRATGLPQTQEETLPREVIGGEGYTSLLTTSFPLRDAWGQIWAACFIAMDVTRHKRLEAEAVRAGQLASIGELAAGVAHEINNPINGIINFSQLMLDEVTPAHRELLSLIIKQAERVAAIVRSLLSYSRSEQEALGPVNLEDLITDSLSLTRYRLEKAGVRVEVLIAPELPLARGRARELQQVLLNLLSNASHALQERRRQEPEAALRCSIRATFAGPDRVALQVEDTGTGIAPESLQKVMLPFFTTKSKEHGTGLGLSISRAIVEAHCGELMISNLSSQQEGPGRGVLAQATLPVWQGPVGAF